MWQQSMCLPFLAGSTCVLTHTGVPRTYVMWRVRHRWDELQKEPSIKKNGGNFCSWPRWCVKDQIYPPTLTKIRPNTWKKQWTSGSEHSDPWEMGDMREALWLPGLLPRERVQTTAKGQETPLEPRGFHVKETEWEAAQAMTAGCAGQRPDSCAGHEQVLGLWGAPGVFSRALLNISSWQNYQGENPKRRGKWHLALTRRGNSARTRWPGEKTHHSQEAG